jgi:hypothetical protein
MGILIAAWQRCNTPPLPFKHARSYSQDYPLPVFDDRVDADLQDKGVRCWFAPHDLPIGAKIWDVIDEAIRLKDKLLLIISKASIASGWVSDEVNKAYAEEHSRKQVVLFPIRIDNGDLHRRTVGRQAAGPAQYRRLPSVEEADGISEEP